MPRSAFTVFGGDTAIASPETGRHTILLLKWRDLKHLDGSGEGALLNAIKKPQYLEVSKEISRKAKGLTIEDDSMAPTFFVGEEIILDQDLTPEEDDFVLVRMPNGEHIFRRYRPRGRNSFDLIPENPAWKTVSVTPSDASSVQILSTMVEHRRKRRPRR